jgi:hypothetical protein
MGTAIRDQAIVRQWLEKLHESKAATVKDRPNYWAGNTETLITTSNIHSLEFGTGCTIYTNSILPAIALAESEVILVTCFWARSRTLEHLNATLIDLSAKSLRKGKKIRVRICFSSLSIFQKLFHTSSLQGQTYPASQWRSKLARPGRKAVNLGRASGVRGTSEVNEESHEGCVERSSALCWQNAGFGTVL